MTDTHKVQALKLARMARRLGVEVAWLRAEAEAGRIPHVRAGRGMLFDPETVEQVISDHLRAAAAAHTVKAGGAK